MPVLNSTMRNTSECSLTRSGFFYKNNLFKSLILKVDYSLPGVCLKISGTTQTEDWTKSS